MYRKPKHIDQYLLFDSHHPLEHKLWVIRTLNHRAVTVSTKTDRKEKKQKCIRGTLKTCSYPNWIFVKTAKRSRTDREEAMRKNNNIFISLCCRNIWESNIITRCTSNLPTRWGRNFMMSIQRTKHPGLNGVMSLILFNAVRTGGGGKDITYHPLTMLYWVRSPDSLTVIHNRAYLALGTHINACWVNDPQVALTTLNLRAHMCP